MNNIDEKTPVLEYSPFCDNDTLFSTSNVSSRDYAGSIEYLIDSGSHGNIYKLRGQNICVKIFDSERISECTNELDKLIYMKKYEKSPYVIELIEYTKTLHSYELYFPIGQCNLHEFIKNKVKPEFSVCDIMNNCINAIKFIHSVNLFHGDISTDNFVYFESDNTFKLIDFGISHILDEGTMDNTIEPRNLYKLNYRPLELLYRQYFIPRKTEIWALGCVLYFILYESLPYIGDSENSVMLSIWVNNTQVLVPPLDHMLCDEKKRSY
jgi:serine/threonine protein kinase